MEEHRNRLLADNRRLLGIRYARHPDGVRLELMDALFSVPTFTITAVCIIILGSKFILDHAANTSPVFQDEIDDLDGTDNSAVPAPRL